MRTISTDVTVTVRRIVSTICATLSIAGVVGAARATTINVNTAGAPSTSLCNLTDAIQAAMTNRKVHGCAAGQAAPVTDTIQLRANTNYSGYGKYLLFPAAPNDGGPVVLAGGDTFTTAIVAQDYGQPSGQYPAENCVDSAIFSGSPHVTIKNLTVTAASGSFMGICHYAGSLTVNNANIGSPGTSGIPYQIPTFQSGAIWSDAQSGQQTLTLNSDYIYDNSNGFLYAGGITLLGPVNATITGCDIEDNTSSSFSSEAGAIWWGGGGNLSVSSTSFFSNSVQSDGGGALGLSCNGSCGTVTLSNNTMQNNAANNGSSSCGPGAGAVYVDVNGGNFPLTISGGTMSDNFNCGGVDNLYMDSLYPSWQTYFSVYCANYAQIGGIVSPQGGPYPQWASYYPLPGDGTCQYSGN
jgi:hypothetical protein